MSLSVGDIAAFMEELAPKGLALEWDNPGFQVGQPGAGAKNVLVALNYNQDVLREAVAEEANLVICHHPLFHSGMKSLRTDLPRGALIRETLLQGIHVYAAHTNLDAAQEGVNQVLAGAFSLKNPRILKKTHEDPLLKLVVFVPPSHLNGVRDALAEAGAGWIGSYSHCSFESEGTGTFMPGEGTNPYIGRTGVLERVEEIRLETILYSSDKGRAVRKMLEAHPYEEPAFDLYPLAQEGRLFGMGRIGELRRAVTLKGLVRKVKNVLGVKGVNVVGEEDRSLKRMAVCGGSGGDLISLAAREGADILLTGDIKYHQAEEALSLGMAVVDAGHGATEGVILKPLASYLQNRIEEAGHKNRVIPSQTDPENWKHM